MKCRCPYCHEVRNWTQRNQCPHCGKSVLPPGFNRKTPSRGNPRRDARERRRPSPWAMPGGLWGMFVARSRVTRWLLGFGAMAVVGALMYAPHQKPLADNPAAIRLAQDNMYVLGIALAAFREDCGRFPTTAESLAALVQDPGASGWRGPYIEKMKPDPWGHPFCYVSDGGAVTLFSVGADGKEGTVDDLQPPVANSGSADPPAIEVNLRGGSAPSTGNP